MRRVSLLNSVCLTVGVLTAGACSKAKEEELTKRLNEANDKVVELRKENNELKNQVAGLKKQLAQALANPNKVTLTDPEIINLIADLKGMKADDPALLGKGALDPAAASKIVMQGSKALVQCYERALKKNQALQYQAGAAVTLELTIRPQGSVDAVNVSPSLDPGMTDCIKSTASRWKFPAFQGEPVVVQQKLTLTPRT
jgi:outer membrane murein-binding lipoprotein Lpp